MSEDPIIQLPVDKVMMPSGNWATFRTSVKYGYRKQLRALAYSVGARASVRRDQMNARGELNPDAEMSVNMDAEQLAAMTTAEEYFPLVYMLSGWSYDLPLPTLADLSPLDEMELVDGEFLLEAAERAIAAATPDFTPTEDKDSPIGASSASAGRSKADQ